MKKYTLAFVFHPSLEMVLLIKKFRKPVHHIGKWNGVGGHIEDGESSLDCIRREIREEAGTTTERVAMFAVMGGEHWTCDCYRAFDKYVQRGYEYTTEEGLVRSHRIDSVLRLPVVCNVIWLMHMALDLDPELAGANILYQDKNIRVQNGEITG